MKRLFDRVWWTVALGSTFAAGCCNIGCKYDLRKYPTPIMAQGTPRAHIWNPDACTSDMFEKVLPPGYQNTAQPPLATPPAPTAQPMPRGPVSPVKAELQAPSWNDPIRGGNVEAQSH